MRIITEPFLQECGRRYPQAAGWLENFRRIARDAEWKNISEIRRTYPHADLAVVKSGRKVVVLNVAGKKYRLIAAIHFNREIIFALKFLTHAEYSKDQWKTDL
jgi:mRNA interferase HigB